MNQLYCLPNGECNYTFKKTNLFYSDIFSFEFYKNVNYCLEYYQLDGEPEDPPIPEEGYDTINGRREYDNADVVRLRLIDKNNSNNYQDIYYGTYENLKLQKYLIFRPLEDFLNGDIIVNKIITSGNSNDEDEDKYSYYFPYENLIFSKITETTEDVYFKKIAYQHYDQEINENENHYFGYRIYPLTNLMESTAKKVEIEAGNDTNFVVVINNQIYTSEDGTTFSIPKQNIECPENINFICILEALGIITLEKENPLDPNEEEIQFDVTCLFINYE